MTKRLLVAGCWLLVNTALVTGLLLATSDQRLVTVFAQETAVTEAPMQVAQAAPPTAAAPRRDDLISLDFKEADLQIVLRALAQKGGVNIVTAKGVEGTVTIHLENVPWETALEVILKTADLGYDRSENVITVMTTEELLQKHQMERELAAQEPLMAKVIVLRYLDAADVQAFLQPQLSPQGRISVLEITGQRGWTFGVQAGKKVVKPKARRDRDVSRSKALLITDTPSTIRRIEQILERLDVKPTQILIEARIMEVNRDLVRDFGVDVATGLAGLDSATDAIILSPAAKRAGTTIASFGLQTLTGFVTPNNLVPKTTTITPDNTGLNFFFRKLTGQQFDVFVRMLEEDLKANILSAPQVVTLSGQEASMVVGTKYPILKTSVAGTTSTTTTTSLDYYQDIGVQLYVVPQISGDKYIDMIIHPVVSSFTTTVGTNAYPIIITREAETQVVIEDGETLVLGGLLKDVKSQDRLGLPFVSKIPVLGLLFSRASTDVEKIDLLIFMTARILRFDEISTEELTKLKQLYEIPIPIESRLKSASDEAGKAKKKKAKRSKRAE